MNTFSDICSASAWFTPKRRNVVKSIPSAISEVVVFLHVCSSTAQKAPQSVAISPLHLFLNEKLSFKTIPRLYIISSDLPSNRLDQLHSVHRDKTDNTKLHSVLRRCDKSSVCQLFYRSSFSHMIWRLVCMCSHHLCILHCSYRNSRCRICEHHASKSRHDHHTMVGTFPSRQDLLHRSHLYKRDNTKDRLYLLLICFFCCLIKALLMKNSFWFERTIKINLTFATRRQRSTGCSAVASLPTLLGTRVRESWRQNT